MATKTKAKTTKAAKPAAKAAAKPAAKAKAVKAKVARAPRPKASKPAAAPKKPEITYDQLCNMSNDELAEVMENGFSIDPQEIEGYEFKGTNVGVPEVFKALFQKFKKCFYRDPITGELRGWNLKIKQDKDLSGPWETTSDDIRKTAHGFYKVYPASDDPTFNHFSQALLINYGEGDNPALDVTALLRDYVVCVNEGSTDLILGTAYLDFGLFNVPFQGYFVLVKDCPLSDVATPPANLLEALGIA